LSWISRIRDQSSNLNTTKRLNFFLILGKFESFKEPLNENLLILNKFKTTKVLFLNFGRLGMHKFIDFKRLLTFLVNFFMFLKDANFLFNYDLRIIAFQVYMPSFQLVYNEMTGEKQ